MILYMDGHIVLSLDGGVREWTIGHSRACIHGYLSLGESR